VYHVRTDAQLATLVQFVNLVSHTQRWLLTKLVNVQQAVTSQQIQLVIVNHVILTALFVQLLEHVLVVLMVSTKLSTANVSVELVCMFQEANV
jgi:hypothetical protein